MALIDDLLVDPMLVNQILVQAKASSPRSQDFDKEHSIFVYSKSISLSSTSALDSVFWDEHNITVCQSNNDVISFNFSGCLMAKTPLTGGNLIFHINCLDYKHPDDRRYDFAKYLLDSNISCSDLTLFQPICDKWIYKQEFLASDNMRFVWGVISRNNECYSLIVDFDTNLEKYKLHSIWLHEKSQGNILIYNSLTELCRFTKENTPNSVFTNLQSVLDKERKVLIKSFVD